MLAACERAAERLTATESFFTERQLVRFAAEEVQAKGVGVVEIVAGARNFLATSDSVVMLGEYRGHIRYTTAAIMKLEDEVLAGAVKLSSRKGHEIAVETFVGTASSHGNLSEEQIRALWHTTLGSGDLAVVSGMAGTGKTSMLRAAKEIWEANGFRVVGAALAARAAAELSKGAEIKSETVARMMMNHNGGVSRFDSKTIFVVDEAGMIATPDMNRIVQACKAAGAKLVLVGDERQLPPIGPGAPFGELGRRHGLAKLTDVKRQDEPWARQAVKDMADGLPERALSAFAERGLLTISESRDESMNDLIKAWRSSGTTLEGSLILAGSLSEVRELNRIAQRARIAASELSGRSIAINGSEMFKGDRIVFTKNRRTLGIKNGDKATLQSFSEDGKRVGALLDNGERVSFGTSEFPFVSLGYATTTHKAQGTTALRAFVLGGGAMQGRELAYVQISRARVQTHIFFTRETAGDHIAHIAKEMAKQNRKHMAAEVKQPEPRPNPGP